MNRGERTRRHIAGRLRDAANRLEGVAYRVRDARPDPDATDAILEQRVRSAIGGLQKRLDVPRVNVTVNDHVATVRGVVGADRQARAVLQAVRSVSGITEARDLLHRGYAPGDTTPSQGRAQRPVSPAWRDLTGAVREIGADDEDQVERLAVTITQTLLGVLPPDERAHVTSHLPRDVRERLVEHPPIGAPPLPRTIEEFEAVVTETSGGPPETTREAIRSVLATLRDLVPEEVADVDAVLPNDLKQLWRGSPIGA